MSGLNKRIKIKRFKRPWQPCQSSALTASKPRDGNVFLGVSAAAGTLPPVLEEAKIPNAPPVTLPSPPIPAVLVTADVAPVIIADIPLINLVNITLAITEPRISFISRLPYIPRGTHYFSAPPLNLPAPVPLLHVPPQEAEVLISTENAVVKIVKAIQITPDKDLNFVISQLKDPARVRPIPELPSNYTPTRRFNPRTGQQEVIPPRIRGQAKLHKTHTKKTSVSLIPRDGKMEFYFSDNAIGFLFDLNQCDQKQEKYTFVTNAYTVGRWWKLPQKAEWYNAVGFDHMRQMIRNRQGTPKHNEALVGLSKEALKALFTTRGQTSDLYQVLRVQQKIQKELGISLPIFQIDPNLTGPNKYVHFSPEQIVGVLNRMLTQSNQGIDLHPFADHISQFSPVLKTLYVQELFRKHNLETLCALFAIKDSLKISFSPEQLGAFRGLIAEQGLSSITEGVLTEEILPYLRRLLHDGSISTLLMFFRHRQSWNHPSLQPLLKEIIDQVIRGRFFSILAYPSLIPLLLQSNLADQDLYLQKLIQRSDLEWTLSVIAECPWNTCLSAWASRESSWLIESTRFYPNSSYSSNLCILFGKQNLPAGTSDFAQQYFPLFIQNYLAADREDIASLFSDSALWFQPPFRNFLPQVLDLAHRKGDTEFFEKMCQLAIQRKATDPDLEMYSKYLPAYLNKLLTEENWEVLSSLLPNPEACIEHFPRIAILEPLLFLARKKGKKDFLAMFYAYAETLTGGLRGDVFRVLDVLLPSFIQTLITDKKVDTLAKLFFQAHWNPQHFKAHSTDLFKLLCSSKKHPEMALRLLEEEPLLLKSFSKEDLQWSLLTLSQEKGWVPVRRSFQEALTQQALITLSTFIDSQIKRFEKEAENIRARPWLSRKLSTQILKDPKYLLFKRLKAQVSNAQKSALRGEVKVDLVRKLIAETAVVSHHRRRRTRDKCWRFFRNPEAQSWKAWKISSSHFIGIFFETQKASLEKAGRQVLNQKGAYSHHYHRYRNLWIDAASDPTLSPVTAPQNTVAGP